MAISLGYHSGAMSDLRPVFSSHARIFWRLAAMLALVAFTAVALSGKLGGTQGGALIMLPALLLAGVMLTRPYLGERVIARLRVRRIRRARAGAYLLGPLHSPTRTASGGRLIAVALASRAPPLALVDCLR
jgi:hypothetical protein